MGKDHFCLNCGISDIEIKDGEEYKCPKCGGSTSSFTVPAGFGPT